MANRPGRVLTARQRRFVEEYALDGKVAAAARRAGYSPGSAGWTGRDLLRLPHVRRALRGLQARGEVRRTAAGPAPTPALEEVSAIAFANLLDYARIDADGRMSLDLAKLDRRAAAGVKELVIQERTDPRTGAVTRNIRLKMADKLPALGKLLAHGPKVQDAMAEVFRMEGRAEVLELDDMDLGNRRASWGYHRLWRPLEGSRREVLEASRKKAAEALAVAKRGRR